MSAEQFTYNQVEQQGGVATVLVPRKNGEISTGRFSGQYDQEGNAVLHLIEKDGSTATKSARQEALSDQIQEKLAVELGGAALRSEFDVLLAGNDEDIDKLAERQAANNKIKAEAAWEAGRLARERIAADHKFNQAQNAGFTPEEAKRSADRAYSRR